MGCISQNGCLGPRRRQKEVSAELVELIYAQAERTQPEISYAAVRSRVTKKGLLRKLLDHLLSHRSKAADCLAYNLRLATQTSSLPRKLAGLLVVDQVTTHLYRTARCDILPDEAKTLTRTTSSQLKLVEASRNDTKSGADLRLDLAYFRLVMHLLETQRKRTVVEAVLQSIRDYCLGRKQRFRCRAEVWRVLELLLQLMRGEEAESAAQCYLLLLELLREGGKEESAHEGDLLTFLRLWMREQERGPDSASNQGLQQSIQKIIRLFVGRCLSGWDAKVLFRSLFQLYQDERTEARVGKVEELVLGMVRECDLQAHVLRGLFLYLLQFLSATPPERNSRNSFSEEFESHRYPRIFERQVRVRLFQTLRRWGEKGYIDLDQCVAFGSSALVAAYTSNFKGERDYVQQIVRQFFRLSQNLRPSSNLILVNLLLDQVRSPKTGDNLRKLLLTLARQLLEGRRILQEKGVDFSNLVVAVDVSFSKEAKMDLLELMSYLVQHLSLQQLMGNEEHSPMVAAICELLHSLHEAAKNGWQGRRPEQEVVGRLQYINATLTLLRALISKYAYLYVLSFLQAVSDRLGLESQASTLSLYFSLYILYEAMHYINPRHKVPDRIIAINFKISPSAKTDIRQEIESFMTQIAGAKGELYPQLRRKIGKDLQSLCEFTMVSEGQLRQMDVSFQSCFKPVKPSSLPLKNDSLLNPFNGQTSHNSQFKRESINGSFYDSNDERSRKEEDESFKDMMQRIGQ